MKAQSSTVTVGVGTTSYNLMPVNTSYNYGLTEQIYTAAEIGQSGTIYSLAFYNSSESVTRNIDIYMVNTDKSSFSDGYDWVAVSSSDLVFSGEVDLVNDMWSTIELTQPFYYSGSGNLLIAVNDNTGNTTSSILFFSVFNAPGQAICATSDDVNCNPFSPGIYGYVVDYKNPIQLGFEPVVCHKPTNLALSDVGANSAVLNWEQPGGGDHWYVQYTTNEYFYFFYEEHVSSTSVTLHNLHPNSTYYVRVANECDSSSISPWCISPSFITTESACPTPSNLTATNVSSTYVNLTWNQPDGGNTWLVEFNTNPSFSSSSATVVHDTSMLLTNLTPNTTYYVHVRNYCDNLNSSHWSNTVSFTTTDETSTCLAPTDLYAFNISANGASIMWNQPDVGANWMVQYSTNADFSNADEITITTRGWYLNGIDPSTHYYVRVAQVCSSSISPWCETAEFTTPASPCATPTGLTVSNISYNGADLNWILTGSSGSCEIEYSTNPDFTSSTTVNTGTTSFSLTNLDPITTYYVRVRLFCGIAAHGSWSNTVSFTTTGGYIACLPPINLTVLNIGSNGAGVSWEQPGDGEQWTIQYSTNADFSNANEETIGGTSWYLYSLEPGTHYYVRVAQVCSFSDMSSWSETEEFTTTGGGNAETEIIDFETATLSEFPFDNDPTYLWSITEAPNDCNNCGNYCMHSGNYGWDNTTSMISATYDFSDDGYISFDAKCAGEATNYDVCEFYIDGNMQFFRDVASWENYMYTVSAGTHTFTWLFRKDQSVSNTGEGFYVDNIVFGVTSPAVCLAPTDLEYSNVSYNGADLTWSQPGDGNEWQIEYSTDPDFTSSEFMSSGATYFPLTVLYPITTYYVRVRQFCGTMAPSSWSNTVSFTTTGGIIIIPDIIDFETGDFSQYTFGQDAENPWIITEAPNDCNNCGAYCMRSGNAGVANSTSTIEITYDFSENGHIAFDAKCAGEPDNYDVCEFYIDGEQQFSHAILDWNYFLYDVPAGTHTFTWTYSKDGSVDNGDDGFFVDNIDFVLGSSVPCLVPTNLTASNIGYNGADVTWSQPGVGSEWHVQCSANPDFYPLLSDNFVNDASFPMTGLDPGTTYYVRVANFCGTMGASDWVSTSFTTLESSCLAPTDLTVTLVGNDFFGLTWNQPGGGDRWIIERSTDPDFSSFTQSLCIGTNITQQSIAPGTYYARVRNYCSNMNISSCSNTVTFTVGIEILCPTPANFTASEIGINNATLSWDADSQVDGWVVEYGTAADFSDAITVTTTANSLDLTGLATTTPYYARVKADCSNGFESNWANCHFNTSFCAATNQCIISYELHDGWDDGWTGAAINVVDVATDFLLDTWTIGDGDFASGSLSVCEGREIKFQWVYGEYDEETSYTVYDFNGNVIFSGSDFMNPSAYYYTPYCSAAPCPVPTGLAVNNVASNSAQVNWSGEGNTYALRYRVIGDDWTEYPSVNPPFQFSSLTPGTDYELQVRANCWSIGTSEWSDPVTFTTLHCQVPTALVVSDITKHSAQLNWTENGTATEWQICLNGDEGNLITYSYNHYQLDDLDPETHYTVKVRANCDDVWSDWSTPVTFTTPLGCSVPTEPTVSNISYHSARLTWSGEGESYTLQYRATGEDWSSINNVTPPYSLAGLQSDVTYEVRLKADCGSDGTSDWCDPVTFSTVPCPTPIQLSVDNVTKHTAQLSWTETGNATSWQVCINGDEENLVTVGTSPRMLYDLDAGTEYTVKMRAQCGIGWSDWSNEVTFTTEVACTTPTSLAVSNITMNSADLTWLGENVTHYVQYKVSTDADWIQLQGNSPYYLDGLQHDVTYNVRVMANCGIDGTSDWSDTVTFTTDIVHIVPTSLYISGVTVFCHGDSVVLQAHADQEVTYVWSTGETGQQITVSVAGDYSVTATSSTGEWIADTVTVTEWETYSATTYDTICPSDFPYMWRGIYIYTAGTRSDTLQTQHGCDSVVTLVLTVNPTYTVTDTQTVCQNELPYVWNGVSFYEAKTKHVTLQTVDGCDSVVYMTLNVNPTYNTPIEATICQGTSYHFFGQPLEYAGEYTHTLQSVNGCDSVITLTLNVNPMYSTEVYDTICEGESYDFFGQTLTQAGGYIHNAQTVNGCDSVITLTLTVNHPAHTAVTETACGSYSWHGTTYTTSGTYLYSHEDANGCTQVDTLHLTIHPTYNTPVSADICQGGSYDFFGQTLTQTGSYTHTLQTVHGCDSVITLTLTVHTMMLTQIADTICEGTSYPFFDQTLTLSGVYAHTLQTVYGCDSVITLALTVLPASHTDLTAESCSSYEWNGVTYTQSGDYSVNYTAANGCDSVVTLHLTILPVQNTAVSADICQGGSYDFFGQALTQTGTYTHTLTSANGCDSVITLSLTVHSMMLTQIADTICEGTSYPFFDQTLTQTGVYAHALQTVYGCDSLITLSLTVLPASHTDLSAEGCDSYEWNGETYTQSGDYSVSHTAANGCDSIVTLHLTINHSVTSEFTIETNEGCYPWNGTEYCQSGDYTQTLQTVAGCDSVVTLHLTVGVGIEDHDLNAAIFLTPNPATNICRINGLETEPISVDLYDMNGKLVRRPNTTEFDVSTLPTGIYMVRVTTNDNRIINLKMVKR